MSSFPQKLFIVLFVALLISSCSSEELVNTNNQFTETIIDKPIEIEILDLINAYRIDNGFASLSQLEIIKSQTNEHTNYMIDNKKVSHDFFHKRKQFLVSNANVKGVGENVAYGYTSAKSVVNAWLKSASHKKNIEGDFNYFEISADKGQDNKWYFTNIFAKK